MPAGITLDGGDELRRALGLMSERIRDAARRAVDAAGRDMQDDAQGFVRVDTGALRDGIERRALDEGLTVEVGVYRPDLYYGQFQEFGTSSVPEQPFLTPAGEAERRRFPERVTAEVRKEIG